MIAYFKTRVISKSVVAWVIFAPSILANGVDAEEDNVRIVPTRLMAVMVIMHWKQVGKDSIRSLWRRQRERTQVEAVSAMLLNLIIVGRQGSVLRMGAHAVWNDCIYSPSFLLDAPMMQCLAFVVCMYYQELQKVVVTRPAKDRITRHLVTRAASANRWRASSVPQNVVPSRYSIIYTVTVFSGCALLIEMS